MPFVRPRMLKTVEDESHYDAASNEIDYFCGGIPVESPRHAKEIQDRKVAEWRIEEEMRRVHG
jgi:hypothetical protein